MLAEPQTSFATRVLSCAGFHFWGFLVDIAGQRGCLGPVFPGVDELTLAPSCCVTVLDFGGASPVHALSQPAITSIFKRKVKQARGIATPNVTARLNTAEIVDMPVPF